MMYKFLVSLLLLLVSQRVFCRPIPRDPDVAYAFYCLDLLEEETYLFRSVVFEEERHNSVDNIISKVEKKLEALGIEKSELQSLRQKLDEGLININNNLKLIQSSLWWVSIYIQSWRRKLKSDLSSNFVSWSNYNRYVGEVDKHYIQLKTVLIPDLSEVHREVIRLVETKRFQQPSQKIDKFIIGDFRENISLKEASVIWESKEVQKLLQQSLILLKQREFRLSAAKEPWDVASVQTQRALFNVYSGEIITNFVTTEVMYKII